MQKFSSLKNLGEFFIITFFSVFFSFTFSYAQLTNDYFNQGASGGAEDTNIYLQENAAPNIPPQTLSPAQKINGARQGVYEGTLLSCPYVFERDLQLNSKGEDVRLLQVLLNSDKRTIIAVSGPGSLGNESTSFGQATKDAVKKFQALFIEYIGVANGRFGPRTRTVMNAICTGDNERSVNGGRVGSTGNQVNFNSVPSIQKNATPKGEITEIPNDKIAPRVSLAANVNSVDAGANFKVIANFSEEVKNFTPESLILSGGTGGEIRKLSKTSYSILITSNSDARQVTVQIEADRVSDLANNLNDTASNEVVVTVTKTQASVDTSTSTVDINSILGKIVSSAPQCTYNTVGSLITADPITGNPLNTTGCAATAQTAATNNQPLSYDPNYNCYRGGSQALAAVPYSQQCNANPYLNQNSPYNNASNPYSPKGQQAQQNQALGQLLGNLLRGNNQNGLNPFSPSRSTPSNNPGPSSTNNPWVNPDTKTLSSDCAKLEASGLIGTTDYNSKCLAGNNDPENTDSNLVTDTNVFKAQEKVAQACEEGFRNTPQCTEAQKELAKAEEEARLKEAEDALINNPNSQNNSQNQTNTSQPPKSNDPQKQQEQNTCDKVDKGDQQLCNKDPDAFFNTPESGLVRVIDKCKSFKINDKCEANISGKYKFTLMQDYKKFNNLYITKSEHEYKENSCSVWTKNQIKKLGDTYVCYSDLACKTKAMNQTESITIYLLDVSPDKFAETGCPKIVPTTSVPSDEK